MTTPAPNFATDMRNAPLPLAFQLIPMVEWWQTAVEQNVLAHGLKGFPRSMSLLIVHITYGERRPIRLAERLGVSRQAVHQLIRQMVARGMLRIVPDPDDGRATIVTPTPDFEQSGAGIITLLHAVEKRMAERFGEEKFAVFNAMLHADWGVPPVVTSEEAQQAARDLNISWRPQGGTG